MDKRCADHLRLIGSTVQKMHDIEELHSYHQILQYKNSYSFFIRIFWLNLWLLYNQNHIIYNISYIKRISFTSSSSRICRSPSPSSWTSSCTTPSTLLSHTIIPSNRQSHIMNSSSVRSCLPVARTVSVGSNLLTRTTRDRTGSPRTPSRCTGSCITTSTLLSHTIIPNNTTNLFLLTHCSVFKNLK